LNRFTNIPVLKSEKGKRYYKNVIYPEIPLSDDDIYVIATGGDRYDKIALQFYHNEDYWWIISAANTGATDSLVITPGTQLRIPANPLQYQQQFEELNRE